MQQYFSVIDSSLKLLFCVSFFLLLTSCEDHKEFKEILITRRNEYWKYSNQCGSHGIYFKFYKNGTYDKFNRFLDGFALFNNDGDLLSEERIYAAENDTSLTWKRAKYRVNSFNSNKIVLSYMGENGKKCEILLKKVID